MNLIDLVEADGGTLRKVSSTHGGEFVGPCPWCGGKDRFRIWPEQAGGRYWCRGCDKAGDSIQYLRERRGLSFVEACRHLGRDPGLRSKGPRPAPAPWTPRDTKTPVDLWQAKARAFLDGAVSCLWSERGAAMRGWLHTEKGLKDATIKAACLGLALNDSLEPRGTWGLEAALKDDGTEKAQWIPAGIVIPLTVGGAVRRLRVRRSNPGDGDRYIVASGSSMTPMVWGQDKGAAVIVESELDGILLSQEAGDLVTCIAMGTATAKPDTRTHEALTAAEMILVSLDTDNAGAKASWHFWPETYGPKVRRWPCVYGKDPSDARLKGLDLRTWVTTGIFTTEERFERFCIQTVDAGLTDGEALRAMARNNRDESSALL